MNIQIISRGKGHSACAAAAYRAGEIIKNEYDGEIHDYTKKRGISHKEIMLPENAPTEFTSRAVLWNSVEHIEKNSNAQLAREVRLVLPREFTHEQNINLVREYVQNNFVARGMCADICLHDKKGSNPHAHVLMALRPVEKDGTWSAKSKMEYILDENGERIKLPSGRYKVKKITATDWDDRGNAEKWREEWANIMNRHLENYGFDIRVDHRSYERQGIEKIPTIHLGSVSHGLEQRGIATERGNRNRAIKAANEELEALNKEIRKLETEKSELLNPPKFKLLLDIENSVKAQTSPGYEHWCRIFNLKQAAQTLLYIQNHGLSDMTVVQTARQKAQADHAEIKKQLDENRAEVKRLTAQKKQAEIYLKTLDFYKKWTAPGQIAFFKNQFYEKHKADIEAHKKAKAFLFDELKLEKFPSLKRLSAEISTLTASQVNINQNLKAAHQEFTAISNAEYNARMLLGYKKLETTGYAPVIPKDDVRNIKPYNSPLVKAQRQEETAQYFNSLHLDIDCAYSIRQMAKDGRADISIAHFILEKYGKERVEKVLAAFASTAATTQTIEAFQFTPPDSLIHAFNEEVSSMVFSKDYGWELPWEVDEREREIMAAKSFTARFAAAERKVKEQDRTPAPTKRRSYDRE